MSCQRIYSEWYSHFLCFYLVFLCTTKTFVTLFYMSILETLYLSVVCMRKFFYENDFIKLLTYSWTLSNVKHVFRSILIIISGIQRKNWFIDHCMQEPLDPISTWKYLNSLVGKSVNSLPVTGSFDRVVESFITFNKVGRTSKQIWFNFTCFASISRLFMGATALSYRSNC